MNCNQAQELVSEALDGALTTAQEARAVAHDHVRATHPAVAAALDRFLGALEEAVHAPESDLIDGVEPFFRESVRISEERIALGDLVARERALPRIEPGDYVLLHDTGAYYFSNPFFYNNLPPVSVYGVTNGEFECWRAQPSQQDLHRIMS